VVADWVGAMTDKETLHSVLLECLDYFDHRADADCDQDGYIPNEEMRMQKNITDALFECGLSAEIIFNK